MKSTFPGEVVKDVAFYDYDAKYIDNKITMAIPAQLDPEVVKIMQTNAEKAFRAIGGLGLARCDFFYTDKGEIFLNELNTMPGFTQWSMYPLLWDNMGLNYTDLITKLVELGKEVFQNTKRICCKKESGTEIGNSLEFDFVVPPSAQLSRAVKADKIQRSRAHSTTASCSTIQKQSRG